MPSTKLLIASKSLVISSLLALSATPLMASPPASTQPMPIKPVKPNKPTKPINRPGYGGTIVVEPEEPEICKDVEYSGRWRKERLCKTASDWTQFKADFDCHTSANIVHCKK